MANEQRELTKADLNILEKHIDAAFARVGIDVEFTHHFLDRVNDERNGKQITLKELAFLFKKELIKWGKPIAQLGPDSEAVMKDLESDINIPFALNLDRDGDLELVAKTVMRKKNFRTPDKEFPVESIEEDATQTIQQVTTKIPKYAAKGAAKVLGGIPGAAMAALTAQDLATSGQEAYKAAKSVPREERPELGAVATDIGKYVVSGAPKPGMFRSSSLKGAEDNLRANGGRSHWQGEPGAPEMLSPGQGSKSEIGRFTNPKHRTRANSSGNIKGAAWGGRSYWKGEPQAKQRKFFGIDVSPGWGSRSEVRDMLPPKSESIEEDVATTQTAKKVLGQVGKRFIPVVGPAMTASDIKSGYDFIKSIPPEERASTGKRWGDAIDNWFKGQRAAIDAKESENIELDDDKMLTEVGPLLPLIAMAARIALPIIARGGAKAFKVLNDIRKSSGMTPTLQGAGVTADTIAQLGALGAAAANKILNSKNGEKRGDHHPGVGDIPDGPTPPPRADDYVGSSVSFDDISDDEILNEVYNMVSEMGLLGDDNSQLDEEMSEKKKKKYIKNAKRDLAILMQEWEWEVEKIKKNIPSSWTYDKAEKMKRNITNRENGLIAALKSMDDENYAIVEMELYNLTKSAMNETTEAKSQLEALIPIIVEELRNDTNFSQYITENGVNWDIPKKDAIRLPGRFRKIAAVVSALIGAGPGAQAVVDKIKKTTEPTPARTKAAGTSLVEDSDDSTNLDINYIPQEDDCECDNESKTTEGLESEENIVYAVRSIDNGYIIFGPYDDEDQAWKDAGPMLHAVLSANQISRKTRQNIDRTGQAKISADNYERMVSEGLETGSQVKGSEARPTNSKDSGKGFNKHPYRGRLVGENFVKDIRKELINEYDQEKIKKKRMERAIIKYMDGMIDDDAQAQQAISKGGIRAKEGFMAAIRDIAFSIERRFNLEPLGIKNSRDVVRLYLTAKVDEMPDDIIPEGKYVSDAQRKAVHAAKDEKENK